MQRPKELLSDKREMLERYLEEVDGEEIFYFPNGFVAGKTDLRHFYITKVFIDKHFRGIGVYKEYFDYLQTILSFRGIEYIEAEVSTLNKVITSMLKTLGFIQTYQRGTNQYFSKRIK